MSFPSRLLTKLNRKDTHFLPKFKLQSKIVLILAIILSLRLLPQLVRSQAPDPSTNRVEYDHEAEIQGSKSGSQEFFVANALAKQVTTVCDAFSNKCPNITEIQEKMKEQNIPYAPPINGGMIGFVNNLNARLYVPPASGIEYIADAFGNFIGKPAYAQGIGFAGLQSILPIWKGFRNIVYILASLILTFIGLLIMLRIKVSPQAVVTIQSALPQLIITLLLVTFSYAIAGLLIDLSYLVQSIVLALLFTSVGRSLTSNLFDGQHLFTQIFLGDVSFGALSNANLFTVFNAATNLIPIAAFGSLSLLIGAIVGGIVAVANPLVGLGIGLVGAVIGPIVIYIFFMVAILYWIIKLFFGLVKCYVTLIFKIIIGPLEIGMGAFPSAKLGFNTWITDVVANLAVFPITLLFIVIANLIVTKASQGMWAPNLLRSSLIGETVNGLANLSGGLVPVALGLGALMLMSQLPELIVQAVFMLKPSAWETAIGKGTDVSGLTNKVRQIAGFKNDLSSIFPKKQPAPQPIPVYIAPAAQNRTNARRRGNYSNNQTNNNSQAQNISNPSPPGSRQNP